MLPPIRQRLLESSCYSFSNTIKDTRTFFIILDLKKITITRSRDLIGHSEGLVAQPSDWKEVAPNYTKFGT